ncbi:hypothetical protein OG292_05710 [Streptomyces sp. NBC_01511]
MLLDGQPVAVAGGTDGTAVLWDLATNRQTGARAAPGRTAPA